MKKTIIKLSKSPPHFGSKADTIEDGVTGNPVQHTHEYYSDDELGLYVGVWDTTDMEEVAEPYSMDEFMLILEGKAIIRDNLNKTDITINAGETFAIPKGFDCQWKQQGYLRKFFFISSHPDEAMPALPSFNGVVLPKVDLAKSKSIDGNPFLSEDLASTDYTDTTGRFTVSTWTAEPFSSALCPFPYHQLLVVQSGSIEVVGEQGDHHSFVQGDAFFIPKGTICMAKVEQSVAIISASLSAA